MAAPATTFVLPPGSEATEPPEARGLGRDQVRLLVAEPGRTQHARFRDLGHFIAAGDLLVVNTSATLPAAVNGWRADGRGVSVHFASLPDDVAWAVVELRPPGHATGPITDARAGEIVGLPAGVELRLLDRYPQPSAAQTRLWRAQVCVEADLPAYLMRHGRPISYAYIEQPWPLSAYQTVFGREPGSAEMASAGRPFTPELVTELVARGVVLAPITLHASVSSPEPGEPPSAERFRVSSPTAELVNLTRAAGRRVIAVGTTVTRALETAADRDGTVHAAEGWTELVLGPDRPARAVTGLITGWHEPGASHLLLLEAVAGAALVAAAYDAALTDGYLWHEFGDSCLVLP